MTEIKKIRRTALVLSIIIGAVLLWFGFEQGKSFYFAFFIYFNWYEWDSMTISLFVVSIIHLLVFMLPLYLICLSLLFSIKKDETPFIFKNVKKLKIIAVLLVIYELGGYLSQHLFNHFFSDMLEITIVDSDGTISSGGGYTTLSGVVLITGLFVYFIALVFQYGITLQEQVDETL